MWNSVGRSGSGVEGVLWFAVACPLFSLPCVAAVQPSSWEVMGFQRADLSRIAGGAPVVREYATGNRSDVFLLGVVHVQAKAEAFLRTFARIQDRINGTSYLAAGIFSEPPRIEDLAEFQLDAGELADLRRCMPGDCDFQLPASAMNALRVKIDWDAPSAREQVAGEVRNWVLALLEGYRREGNRALGVYDDRRDPVEVDATMRGLLERIHRLPEHLPALWHYILQYPEAIPAEPTHQFFYWETVQFGLKPTFRVNHVIVYRPDVAPGSAWVVVDKQLYANHYFQSALDFWFCLSESTDAGRESFYLINLKASRQHGLTGLTGRVARPIAVSRARAAMEAALVRLKDMAQAQTTADGNREVDGRSPDRRLAAHE